MEIRQLRTLIAVADHRTFADAAEAIGLTQSAVSQQLRALEDELQTPLFDRTTRPTVLNVHGRTLLEGARNIVENCDDVTRSISGEQPAGTLYLGAMRTTLFTDLPRALAALRNKHPQLRVKVTSGKSEDLAFAVSGGRLDAAVVAGPLELPSHLNWRPYFHEPLLAIAPPSSAARSDREILTFHPYIRFSRNVALAHIIDTSVGERGIAVNQEMEIESLLSITRMVSCGLGASVVPQRAIVNSLQGNLKIIPFGEPPLHRFLGVVDRVSNPKSHLVRALFQELWQLSGSPELPE